MYQGHWGLQRTAFSMVGDPRWFFPSPTHEEALARLEFLVRQQKRLGVLLGPAGTGKTMTLSRCAQGLRQDGSHVVQLSLLGIEQDELLWRVAMRLGASPRETRSLNATWQVIDERLTCNRYQQLDTVLLLDDAEQAGHDVLTAVARLAQLDAHAESRFCAVLAVESGRAQLIGPRLRDLCQLRIDLEPWDRWQMARFISWSLDRAGATRDIFTPAAYRRLHELTGGVARRVVQLAELALVAGAGEGLEWVDEATIEAANDQLALRVEPREAWA